MAAEEDTGDNGSPEALRELSETEQAALRWVDRLTEAWMAMRAIAEDEDTYCHVEAELNRLSRQRAAIEIGDGRLFGTPQDYNSMVNDYATNQRLADAGRIGISVYGTWLIG